MSRIKVKHVILYGSEAFNGEQTVTSIFEADRVIQRYVSVGNMGFAKTKLSIVFEDGETVEASSDYNVSLEESVGNMIYTYHKLVQTNKMPKWYAIYGDKAVEKWAGFCTEHLDFIERYDYGLGF